MINSLVSTWAFIFLNLISITGLATWSDKSINPLDLPLDLTGAEYEQILSSPQFANQLFDLNTSANNDDNTLKTILQVGKRNLDWLTFINKSVAAPNRLSFSSAETQEGYPLDQPRAYNPSIIATNYQKLVQDLPVEIKNVVINGAAFTATPPIDTKEYLKWGRLIDSAYQISARWFIMKPYLWSLEDKRYSDIRGYYFLSTMADREVFLKNFTQQTPAVKEQVKGWLFSMCNNERSSDSYCTNEVQSAISKGTDLNTLYNSHVSISKKIYDRFFNIPLGGTRNDLKWLSGTTQNELTVPFQKTDNLVIENFLKVNIEDEWKFNDWHLKLNFVPDAAVNIQFEAGATPHVNGIGGNTITMDANAPLEEYNVQWAIRHEFGHVLGFPDCYLEFYDPTEKAIYSYQLDITDLMCSRRGHLKERHYNELSRVYR
jgi:hypothetical protein